MRVSRFLASTGVRLAFVQALLLITVFAVAGSLTKVTVKLIYRHDLELRLEGEANGLIGLYRTRGLAYVTKAIADAERRPGGFEYRLAGPDGRQLSGDLPPTGAPPGITYLDWDDFAMRGRPFEDLLVDTHRLPDGTTFTVGQNLAEESQLRHTLGRTLFWCGAIGASLGLGLSYLFAHGALRRIEGVVSAARAVSAGRMQMRAPTRSTLIPDDIDELGSAFNGMLDEIATLVGRIRWVSTDIAHDLRTPLTHVRQKLERIRRSDDPQVLAAAVEIERDVNDLLRTFDAMLKLAEIESDVSSASAELVDLAEQAGRIADAYKPDIEASGRQLILQVQSAPVIGDADLIGQAIANLLENAMHHTPIGALIRLCVESAADRAMISVIDDGPGIPADQREAVLERFHRLEASRSTPGSGLGLPIVAAIAKRHGAILVLTSAEPGLNATLLFPAQGASSP